jgi:hypothetical protein
MPNPEPALPELDATLAALEHSAPGQALRSASGAIIPSPAFARRLEAHLRVSAPRQPARHRAAWSYLLASGPRRFVVVVAALLLMSGCGALALAAGGQRIAGLPAPWPRARATLNIGGTLLVVTAALGVFSGAAYWWSRRNSGFGPLGMMSMKGVPMQNMKHFLWRTRSVSLTAVVVLTITAVFWTLGAGASPFHDNNNQLPVITLQTTTDTDTTTTGTTTTGTTTTATTTATTTTGATTTGTTTTGTTTTGTTTTGTTTTGTTTGTTTTGSTTTGPGALPAQSNACDQKHPDQGNDTQNGQPGTPGHNNPRCFTTTTGTTTTGATSAATTVTTTEGSELPAQSNACDDKHPDQGNDGNGHNNPRCASATSTTSASAATSEQDQEDNSTATTEQEQDNNTDNGDHGNGNGHGNGNNDNPAPAKTVPPSNGNGGGNNGNGGNGGNNGGNNGNGGGNGKHK